jgi:hypothetical protein
MVQAVVQADVLRAGEMPVQDPFDAPALRWEPCVEAHGADELGLCAGCGWPVGDHDDAAEPEPGHGAVVIRVPERLPLRRAS